MATEYNQFAPPTYLTKGSAPATAVPISMFCWFKPDILVTSTSSLITIERANNGHDHFSLILEGTGTTTTVGAAKERGSSAEIARAASTYTTGAWQTAGAVFSANDNMIGYYNGVAGTPNTTFVEPFAPFLDSAYIGAFDAFSTFVFQFHGCLAAAAIWNTALSAGEMLDLYNGDDPRTIQAAFLIDHIPMVTAATVATNTQGTDWSAIVGGGSFSDCSTAPPITPYNPDPPPPAGSGRRWFANPGPVQIITAPIVVQFLGGYLGGFLDGFLGTYL